MGKRDLELTNQSGEGMALVVDNFTVREMEEAQNGNSDTLRISQYVEDYRALDVDDDSVFSSNDKQGVGDS